MYYFFFQEKGMCSDYKNFKDLWETTCIDVIRYQYCKNQWTVYQSEDLKFSKNMDGFSVADACCACGGGEIGKLMYIRRHLFLPLY